MKFLVLIWIFQVVWVNATDYYHKNTIEFRPPKLFRNNSYFGFSTTYDRYNKKLIISAPRENENGTVYECDISTQECLEIHADIERHSPAVYNHDYWFGATVKAGPKFVVACAPRLTKRAFGTAGTFGQCYKRKKNETNFSVELKTPAFEISPLYSGTIEPFMETLGWSLDIAPDSTLIVGGPGMYKKTGSAAISMSTQNFLQLDRIQAVKAKFNFGYSVAIGYFLSDKVLCFAVGSTYGEIGYGGVYIYCYNHKLLGPYTLNKNEDIDEVGSMFGAVLCTAKLQSLGIRNANDLLVGAPTYAPESTYNAGAVYVYIYQSRGLLPKFKRKITCQKSGAFFGSAIVNVGDLNGDGRDEIAIAAPYEDDNGAVYLYSGAELVSDKSEKRLTHLQRISPSGYHSFGLSLSVLQDHDDNGCNELAIGAPFEDRVVVYRCMAAITITEITTEFPKLQNRHQKHFNFTVCIHIKYPKKPYEIFADISTDVAIHHVDARLSHPNNGSVLTYITSLRDKNSKYCQVVEIILPLNGNYGMQIGYEISTRILTNPMELGFESSRVILSDTSVFSNKGAVWAAECAGDKECKPILDMHISSNISKPFMIGSKEMETLKIDVMNTGEIAYNPCIQFKVENAVLYRPPLDCTEMNTLDGAYECTYRKPLRTAQTWTIEDITLNLKGLTSRNKDFAINAILFNECRDNKSTQVKEYNVPLQSHYQGLDIKGTTNIGDVINLSKQDLRDGKLFMHIYTVTNNGMTNFEKHTTEIKVTKEEFMIYPQNSVTKHVEDKCNGNIRTTCPIIFENSAEFIAKCVIDFLPRTHFYKIMISMEMLPDTLDYNNLLKANVTQKSNLNLIIDSYKQQEGITTIIQINETAVALWIIILAVLLGILLLAIFVVALSLCGCLTRKKKEELKDLKEKIKRESYRRSMMHPPQSDRQSLMPENRVE